MKKITTLLFSFVQVTLSMAQYCNQLDQVFGVNGRAIGMSMTNEWIYTGSIFLQPDNKIIQISSTNNTGFHVVRYTKDGQIDNSFGVNGKASYNPANGYSSYASFGVLQSDGKIVVVGKVNGISNYYGDIVLIRFNSDGSLDNTFGTGGRVVTAATAYDDEGNGLAIQPDGKILVAGFISNTCFSDCYSNQFCLPSLTVLRYNGDGTLDATFGQGGTTVIPTDPYSGGRGLRVMIQGDGKIVAAGNRMYYYCDDYYGGQYSISGLLMARFDEQGKVDSTFGFNGIVKDTTVMSYVATAAMQPDGKIIISGSSNQGGNVTKRYHADGKPDNSFISPVLNGYVNAMTLNNDGRIVLGGVIYKSNIPNLFVARLNSNGSPDNNFSGDGQWYLANNSLDSNSSASGVAIQQDHIIAGGVGQYFNSTNGNYRYDQFVTRLKDSIDDITVAVDRSGPLYPCEGQNVVLSIHQSGTFQWYKDAQLIVGATDSIINATSSGNYSVKVINSGKCGESADVPVFFNSLPVTVIPESSLNICNGDSVKLVSSEPGILQWFINGFEINGATDIAYVAKSEGHYNVAVKNSKGCGASSSVYVYINPNSPVITWDLNNLWTNGGYYNYQWYRNGIAIPGANGENYHPVDTGSYKVVIEDYGCNNTSDEIHIDCNNANVPVPVIYWDGGRLNTSPGFSGYQWYLNGNAISAADTSFLQTTEFGSYMVRITGNLNCTNTSNEFVFSCNVAGPSKPTVNWNSSQFSTLTGYSSYQWYRNDTAIAGATTNTYTPAATQFGFYKVTVTNDLNCSSTSDPKPYFITASNDLILADASLRYYPNPVSNTLFIDVTMQSSRKIVSTLYDLSGKRIRQQSLKQGRNQIQLEHLSSGMYQLEVQYGVERKVVKVVVVR